MVKNNARMKLVVLIAALLFIAAGAGLIFMKYSGPGNSVDSADSADSAGLVKDYESRFIPLSDVSGNHVRFTWITLKDGIKYIPDGAFCVKIITVRENDAVYDYLKTVQPGLTVTKAMIAYFDTGAVEYYAVDDEKNASIAFQGDEPIYESYKGYHFFHSGKSGLIKFLAGNPFLILTTGGEIGEIEKDIVDAASGNKAGTTFFDDILIYADDVSVFEDVYVYAEDDAQKYYHRSSHFENGSFQFEAIVLNPDDNIKYGLIQMTKNETESVTYNFSETGDVIKIYISGENEPEYTKKTKELYNAVFNEYNRQRLEKAGMIE
ncbi:MAG: hypothetical protein RBQ94_03760 [Methanimicrococcus sp.]|nr:hypothetical protein [Methanimicrococcus sp.]